MRRGINDSDDVPPGQQPNADVVGGHRPAPKKECCYYCRNVTYDQKERVAKRVCGIGLVLVLLLVILTAVFSLTSDPTDTYVLRAGETRQIPVPSAATFASLEFVDPNSAVTVLTSPAAAPPTLTGAYAVVQFGNSFAQSGTTWVLNPYGTPQQFHLNAGSNVTALCRVSAAAITLLAFAGQSDWDDSQSGAIDTYAFAQNSGPTAVLSVATATGGEEMDVWLTSSAGPAPSSAAVVTGNCSTAAYLTTYDVTGFGTAGTGSLTLALDGDSEVNYVVLRGPLSVPAGAQSTQYAVTVTAHRRMFASAYGRIATLWIVAAVVVAVWICAEVYAAKRSYEPYERDQALMGQTIADAFD